MDTSSWQGFIAPCKFALSSRHIEKISSNRCLVELVNPQEKQGNKICRRIMLFLSNINSEYSIPGSVSPLLQPKQTLATWKCFTNRHPMICEAGTDISKTYPQITSPSPAQFGYIKDQQSRIVVSAPFEHVLVIPDHPPCSKEETQNIIETTSQSSFR